MVFKGKKHILFSKGLADLTYRCDTCDVETKRIAKASWLRVKSRRHRHHRNRPSRRGPVAAAVIQLYIAADAIAVNHD